MLKLLNTDNKTAAITSHNSKFLTISFNAVSSQDLTLQAGHRHWRGPDSYTPQL